MNERTFLVASVQKLEDPARQVWLPVAEVLAGLGLQAGEAVADIGAGTGYFALPMAEALGDEGLVAAVDVQEGMLELLRAKLAESAGARVECRLATAEETGLPAERFDVAFYGLLWHELDAAAPVLKEAGRIVKRGGRIGILEWRKGVGRPPGPPEDHRIDEETLETELVEAGWSEVSRMPIGPYAVLVTAKRA